MMVCHRAGAITATTALASACQTATYNMQGGGAVGRSLFVFVGHQGGIGAAPVTALSYGSDIGFFLAAQQSPGTDVTVEVWEIDQPATQSGTIIAACDASVTQAMAIFGVEVEGFGALALNTSLAAGSTSPITLSYTDSAGGGGNAAGAVVVPVTNNLQFSCGLMYQAATTAQMSLSNGTADPIYTNPFSFGSVGDKLQMAVAYQQSTGGSDTISWTESANRVWAQVTVIAGGCAQRGTAINRCFGITPNYYAVGSRP
jgi:hypothetical protein